MSHSPTSTYSRPRRQDRTLRTAGSQNILQPWRAMLDALLRQLSNRVPPNVADAMAVLESLPLETAEFATSRLRLENAKSYAQDGEWGAAGFELRMLGILE